jgi:internalin A
MIRTEVVEGLYAALAKDGFQPVRDSGEIRPGDRISPFIRRLTRADLVVTVISAKYLHSYYCMYEIYRLWQRFQGDGDELARHVVPIVLPEVRVGSLKERAPYLKYWNEQKAEHDALRLDLGLSLSAEDWDEVRLVHEFSHHVGQILGFLNDVLMPRKLEDHLDHGFEAVREALRRRLRER